MRFTENICADISVKASSEREAYIIICINELLHTLGIVDEQNHSTTYAIMSDNEHFKLF